MNYIVKSDDVDWQPKFFPNEQQQYGEFKPLWQIHGMEQIEVRITKIPAQGTHTKYHTHTKEEEWFYVLEGSCHVNIEGQWEKVATGDSIYKPPGIFHIFRNFGDQPCVVIMLGTNIEGNEVLRTNEPAPPVDLD